MCIRDRDYIWHIGWQIEPIPSKQDYRRDHKQETKEHKVFKGDPERLEQIGDVYKRQRLKKRIEVISFI